MARAASHRRINQPILLAGPLDAGLSGALNTTAAAGAGLAKSPGYSSREDLSSSGSSSLGGTSMSEAEEAAVDFAAADPKLLELILAEADKRLAVQVQLMLAADARAGGIRTGCITLSAAGLGLAMAQLKDGKFDALFWASATFAAVEMVGAFVALLALWPAAIKPAGWSPATFAGDLGKAKRAVQGEIAGHLSARIEANRRQAARLGALTKWAMAIATAGPVIGLIVGLAVSAPASAP